jgi:hypothetical protein
MALQTEIWVADIKEKLFPANSFMAQAMDDSMFVENLNVNLANAGALPLVQRNRAVIPATVTQRADVDIFYRVHEFTSDPTVIRDVEDIETAFDKRQSVLKGHIDSLNNKMANWLLYSWAPTQAANIQRTTGTTRAAVIPGATGNRKPLLLADIFTAKGIMDDMDVPEEGRMMLMPAYMYNDLLLAEKASLVSLERTGEALIQRGELVNLLGFRIIKRGKNNVLSYTNAGTPVPRIATNANDAEYSALTSANAAVLMWHPDFVRRALGAIKVYANENDPTLYGSAFSTMARAGGRKAYSDETGVVAIVEAAA